MRVAVGRPGTLLRAPRRQRWGPALVINQKEPSSRPQSSNSGIALYDDLHCPELQGLILGYVRVAFTNESLRATVAEYFEDRAACERRHGKIGRWASVAWRASKLFLRTCA